MGGIWGDILKLFGFGSFSSPREDLLKSIVGSLWAPPAASLTSQGYLRMVSYFLWFAVFLVSMQFLYALGVGLVRNVLVQELKSWAYSSAVVFGGVYLLPGLFMTSGSALNAIGRDVVGQFLGTNDPNKVTQIIGTLTGHASLDFVLSIVQIGFLLMLAIEVKLVFVAMYLSVVMAILGVTMRWLGDFGDNFFKFCVNVTVYGIAGNTIILLVVSSIVGIARATTSNTTDLGLLNTAAIAIASFICYIFMKRMGGRMKAIASGTVRGVHGARDRLRHGLHSKSGGGAEQTKEESASHRGHASKVAAAVTKIGRTTPGGKTQTSPGAGTTTTKVGTLRRHSSTVGRSLMNRGSSKASSKTGVDSTNTVKTGSSRIHGGASPAQTGGSQTGTSSRHPRMKAASKGVKAAAMTNPVTASASKAYTVGKTVQTRHATAQARHNMRQRNAAERRQS